MTRKRQSATGTSAAAGVIDHEVERSLFRGGVKVFDPHEARRKIAELVGGGNVSQAPRGLRDETNDETAAQLDEFEARTSDGPSLPRRHASSSHAHAPRR